MIGKQRVCVILPAYNAARTLERTCAEIPRDVVDDVVLTDDASQDDTVQIARRLGLFTIVHDRNKGYGANQKTCYAAALDRGADIVVMLHPDYQYSPRLVQAMAAMLASGHYEFVLASRILGGRAVQGGMPRHKYLANRALTFTQNCFLGARLSEYHTGYRAWTRKVLETLPLGRCSDDFLFDNQMLVQALHFGFRPGEISCPTRYLPDSSSIGLGRSVLYALGVLQISIRYRLHHMGWRQDALLAEPGR